MSDKYYIIYTENSEPKIKKFKTYSTLCKFLDKFKVDTRNGYWLDFIIKGQVTPMDAYWHGKVK